MKQKIEEFNKLASKHSKVAFYVIAGILSLTIAFAIGQCSAPIDIEDVCENYIEDNKKLGSQLEDCRSQKVAECDERIKACHEDETKACQAKLDEFREICDNLACQE